MAKELLNKLKKRFKMMDSSKSEETLEEQDVASEKEVKKKKSKSKKASAKAEIEELNIQLAESKDKYLNTLDYSLNLKIIKRGIHVNA